MKRLLLFLSSLLLFLPLAAEPLSLAELIDMALKNNPETERSWANVKRIRATLGLTKSANYPRLDGSANLAHNQQVEFPNGPTTVFTTAGADLCLSYLLFDFGERRAAVQAMKEALHAAQWHADFAVQQVIYKVSAAYYAYLSSRELLTTKEKSLQDAGLILQAAEELYRAGLRSVTDLTTSKAETALLHIEVAQQKARTTTAYGQLLNTLGLPLEQQIEVQAFPEELPSTLFAHNSSQLIALAEERRADFLAKKAVVAEMQQRLLQSRHGSMPKVRTFGKGGWAQYSHQKGSRFTYSVGAALDLPLFHGFETTYQQRMALADEELSLAELRELRQAIALDVLTYSQTVQAAEEALKWSEEYLTASTKSYDKFLESYKAGLHTIFELIQAQRFLADARIKKTEAQSQWLVALAALAFATGGIE